jgi:DNA-binding NtrC family response regulator
MKKPRTALSGHPERRVALDRPLRVLVADDDATLRTELGALLAEHYAPATPLEASDVPSATEALLVRHPDLVVTDLRLPGHVHGGFRLILDAVSFGVPTVVTSGRVSRAMEQRLSELGVGFVQKGSTASALFAAVDRALSLRSDRREPQKGTHRHDDRPRVQAAF